MYRKYLAGLMVLPVLLAAWVTFSASPVEGMALDQVAMFDLPDPDVAEAQAADPADAD
jgi:hypothetical protein